MKYLGDVQWTSADGSVHRFKEIYQLTVDEPIDYGTTVAHLVMPAWAPTDQFDYNMYVNNWTYLTADRLLFLIRLITNSIGDGESENIPEYYEMQPNCLTYPEWYYSDGKHSLDDIVNVPSVFPFNKSYIDLLTSLSRAEQICVLSGSSMKISNFNDAVAGDGLFDLIIPAKLNTTILSGFSQSTDGWSGLRVDNIWASAKFSSISDNAFQAIGANLGSGTVARSLAPVKRFCQPMQNQVLYNPMGAGSLSGLWGLRQLQINRLGTAHIASLFTLKEDKPYDWTDGYGGTYTMVEVTVSGSTYFAPSTLTDIVINDVSAATLAREQSVSIAGSQFSDMTMLQSVKIGSGYSNVGVRAFQGCSALTDFSIKECSSVGYSAFEGCSSLSDFNWNFAASRIESNTFKSCTKLTTLRLSSSVTFIATDALDGCRKLSDIYYDGTKANWDNNVTKPGEGAWPSANTLTLHCADGDYELQHPIE